MLILTLFTSKATTENELIYVLTYMEVKNNKMSFNSRDWLTTARSIFNSVLRRK